MPAQAKTIAFDWVEAHRELLAARHQQIWALAEVGLQERKTSKLLADLLAAEGFTVERGVAGILKDAPRPGRGKAISPETEEITTMRP